MVVTKPTGMHDTHHLMQLQRGLQTGLIKPADVVRRYRSNIGLLQRMEQTKELVGHAGCVNTIQWNSSGNMLLSGSDDTDLIVWDFPSGKIRHKWASGHVNNIFCAQFMESDKTVVSGARDGQVWVHSLAEGGKRLHRYECHTQDVKKIAMDPQTPSVFMSCSEDGTVRLYDLREHHTCAHTPCTSNIVVQHRSEINSVSVNPVAPHLFVVAGGSKYVSVYDRRMLQVNCAAAPSVRRGSDISVDEEGLRTYTRRVARFCPESTPSRHITGVRYSNTGKEIVASYSVDGIYMFDSSGLQIRRFSTDHTEPQKGKTAQHSSHSQTSSEGGKGESTDCPFIRKFTGHCNIKTVKDVNFLGPGSEYVMTGSDDGFVYIWHKNTGELAQRLQGDEDVVNQIIGHPSQPVIACSGIDDTIKVFEPTAIQPVDLKDAQEAMERNIARTSRSSAVSGSNFPFITYPDGSDGAIIRIGNIAVMLSNASSLAALFTTRRLQNALRGTDGSDDSDEEEDEGEPHDTPMNEDNNSDADSDLHPTAVAGSDSDEHSNDHSNSDGDDSGDVCGEPNPAAPVPADGMDRDSRGMSHGQDESEDEGDEQDLDPGEGSTRGMSMSSSAMRALSNVGERPGKPTTRTRVGAGAMWSGRVQASRERQRERERERQRHRGASGERRVSAQTRAPVYSSTSPPYRRPRATTAEAHAQNATDVARTRTDADDMDVDAEEVEHDDKP